MREKFFSKFLRKKLQNLTNFVVFFALFFLLWFGISQKLTIFESRVYFLLLPQDKKTAIQLNQVSHNLAEILNYSLFYQKKDREAKKNLVLGSWQAVVLPQSSIIELKIYSQNSLENKKLKKALVNLFLQKISSYYNIDKEINVRIVRNTISAKKNPIFYSALLSFSIVLGLCFLKQVLRDYFINFTRNYSFFKARKMVQLDWENISNKISNKNNKKNKLSQKEKKEKENKSANQFKKQKDKQEIIQKKEQDYSQKNQLIKKSKAPNNLPTQKQINTLETGDVPSNLPIGNYENPPAEKPEKETNGNNKESNKVKNEEPTEEEYKTRLNQLLQGEDISDI